MLVFRKILRTCEIKDPYLEPKAKKKVLNTKNKIFRNYSGINVKTSCLMINSFVTEVPII